MTTLLQLDAIQTLAFAGMALFVGHGIVRTIPTLGRYNLPAPIIGGLVVAMFVLFAHGQDVTLLRFDTKLQSPLMIAFFTSIGLSASVSLLRTGGPQVLLMFGIATFFAIAQNALGVVVALVFGLPPLFGVLAGSVTLTGGPATGLAFAPLFEQAGISGAGSIAVAMAMAGIVAGGLVGGPVGTFLIERHRLSRADRPPGSGAAIRNLDDLTGWIGMSLPVIENIGVVALALFLAMALMTLELWNLAGLALPLIAILVLQVLLVALACFWPIFQMMGRDYSSAVMSGGFIGFMLGTMANAMAVMRTLVERYGPAPQAFLVAPLVGAFFIDFANALIITICLNIWG